MWKKIKEWFVNEEKRNILFVIVSAVTLILSLTEVLKSVLPFDIAWVAIVLCGIPIVVGSITALIKEHGRNGVHGEALASYKGTARGVGQG